MRRVLAGYFGLGLLLWPIPLLNVLQVESAAVVALVAFFVSGLSALSAFESPEASVARVVLRQEGALLVPLALLTIAQLWAPNCTYGQGLLFYALFPGVTVVFSVAVAYALQGTRLSRPRLALVVGGLLIVIGGPLYDFGLHPQFYTYNHVFGGILGPIYDEQLAVRPGLFAFRGLTLLWAGAALMFGLRRRGRGPRWVLPILLLVIGGVYAYSAPLGLNTPAWYLREQLGGHVRTENFDVYYDPKSMKRAEVEALVQDHEAHYGWVLSRLEGESAGASSRIQSYVYPTPEAKGRLTGARTTSVSPVWLDTPQIHLLEGRVEASLGHELAHVVGRPFGLPGINASWAPGLVEGWAVALEPPTAAPSPDDLVLTAMATDTAAATERYVEGVVERLSPWGFWTGRGAVSYATMGSFVQYLLEAYGPERLKHVYAWANFEEVYGRSLRSLATEWVAHLRERPLVSRAAHGVVTRRFTRPSLFEVECPHYVPRHRRQFQQAERAARRRDTTALAEHLRQALDAAPRFAAAHRALAQLRLAQRQEEAVRRQLDTLAASARPPGVLVAQADAHVLDGDADTARTLYAEAREQTPFYAHETRARLLLRDAVAARPEIVRILVSGDSAHVQARRLADRSDEGDAVRAWQGVRLMDARAYASALALWRTDLQPISPGRPAGWARSWTLQQTAWGAEAALRAGSTDVAERWAERAAREARTLGDLRRAAVFDWWAGRAGRDPTYERQELDGMP